MATPARRDDARDDTAARLTRGHMPPLAVTRAVPHTSPSRRRGPTTQSAGQRHPAPPPARVPKRPRPARAQRRRPRGTAGGGGPRGVGGPSPPGHAHGFGQLDSPSGVSRASFGFGVKQRHSSCGHVIGSAAGCKDVRSGAPPPAPPAPGVDVGVRPASGRGPRRGRQGLRGSSQPSGQARPAAGHVPSRGHPACPFKSVPSP